MLLLSHLPFRDSLDDITAICSGRYHFDLIAGQSIDLHTFAIINKPMNQIPFAF
jgi:hypothetical protein